MLGVTYKEKPKSALAALAGGGASAQSVALAWLAQQVTPPAFQHLL